MVPDEVLRNFLVSDPPWKGGPGQFTPSPPHAWLSVVGTLTTHAWQFSRTQHIGVAAVQGERGHLPSGVTSAAPRCPGLSQL